MAWSDEPTAGKLHRHLAKFLRYGFTPLYLPVQCTKDLEKITQKKRVVLVVGPGYSLPSISMLCSPTEIDDGLQKLGLLLHLWLHGRRHVVRWRHLYVQLLFVVVAYLLKGDTHVQASWHTEGCGSPYGWSQQTASLFASF